MIVPEANSSISQRNARALRTLQRSLVLSRGQFSLLLVRCDYGFVQGWALEQMHAWATTEVDLKLQCLSLSPTTPALLPTIERATQGAPPDALFILGLEALEDRESVLALANLMRDRFRELSFPVALWLDGQTLDRLGRLAQDLKSWAVAPIQFEGEVADLRAFVERCADEVFGHHQRASWGYSLVGGDLAIARDFRRQRRELEMARLDLARSGAGEGGQLEAILAFAVGREAYESGDFEGAAASFLTSERGWMALRDRAAASPMAVRADQWCSILPFHRALCAIGNAQLVRPDAVDDGETVAAWQRAREILAAAVAALPTMDPPPDLVPLAVGPQLGSAALAMAPAAMDRAGQMACLLGPLGEALERLQDWPALAQLAQGILALHRTEAQAIERARGYGFGAAVAQAQGQWQEAAQEARKALALLRTAAATQEGTIAPEDRDLWRRTLRSRRSRYLLQVARAQRELNRPQTAIAYLEQARQESQDIGDIQTTLSILALLRQLYFEQGRHLEAFTIKQGLRLVEHQYGLLAFVGPGQLRPHPYGPLPLAAAGRPPQVAPEIAASGRQADVQRLIARLARPDRPLTVIYGKSGVGKSSTVKAGLVPELFNRAIGDRDVLPVVVEVYTDWVGALENAFERARLAKGLGGDRLVENWNDLTIDSIARPSSPETALGRDRDKLDALLEQLERQSNQSLLTVLMFDQFEEFFFTWPASDRRQQCFEFLQRCLNIPYVKIVLSLREDYLHLLLEWERAVPLDVVDNNILDSQIRYYLGDFSAEAARSTIASLTARSQFHLAPDLVEALVAELVGKTGEVTPIELQVVGAQLQSDRVRTLADYQRRYGQKDALVKRYLQDTIADCGPDRHAIAWQVLFMLTHENGTRPLKTRADIAAELLVDDSDLETVLQILVGAGLVVLFRESSADFYQLVHDYLVNYIRRQQRADETAQFRLTKTQLNAVLRKRVKELYAAGFVLTALLLSSVGFAARLAAGEANAQIEATSTQSAALLGAHQEFDALLMGLTAWQERQKRLWLVWSSPRTRLETQMQVAATLQQALGQVREKNRLEGHGQTVWAVRVSADGKTILSASSDRTVRVWNADGSPRRDRAGAPLIFRATSNVSALAISPDGRYAIAGGNKDNPTLWIWSLDGTLVRQFQGHSESIYCISISPDGRTIASASEDRTVRLWTFDGQPIRTLTGHGGPVQWVTFSPDGRAIATASDDRTARLWTLDGQLLQTFQGHRDWVYNVSFSPDGQRLATGSTDKTVKLWNLDGKLLQTLTGHTSEVFSLAFSPDGRQLASSSADKTIRLWNLKGENTATLLGHTGLVTSAVFTPDGRHLVSGSYDKTVRLWDLVGEPTTMETAHLDRIQDTVVSPDGQRIATASIDGTIALWNRQGQMVEHLRHGNSLFSALAFDPSGRRLVSGDAAGELQFWAMDAQGNGRRTAIAVLTNPQEPPGSRTLAADGPQDDDTPSRRTTAIAFAPDGETFASSHRNGFVHLWDKNGILIRTLDPLPEVEGRDRQVNAVAFSPNGQVLAIAGADNTVRLMAIDGTPIRTLEGHSNYVADVAFSPDGRYIASAGDDNAVRLWTSLGGLVTILGHDDGLTSLRFSPDSQFLATGSWDGSVSLWSVGGKRVKQFNEHRDGVGNLDFSADGKLLVSGGYDQRLVLRNLDMADLLKRTCRWLTPYLQTYGAEQRALLDTCREHQS
jgi:WD40 repeat protein/tetratricopeptide (TPR) repeat protein